MMKKLTASFLITLIVIFASPAISLADTVTDNGLNYLKSKQNSNGQITGGTLGDASTWSAIAFGANGIDISTVKSGSSSLKDYLSSSAPTLSSAATEWEKWILAIVAGNENPNSFNGVNYIDTLKSATYYNNNQLGDTSSVNEDWFGAMALIAGGVANTDSVLTDVITFIISKQNSDGGWGYAVGADSDSNDTAAAVQALVQAKNIGVANADLDGAISRAKTYLISLKHSSGGFRYDGMPWSTDPDIYSTSWVLMSLNVLGESSSTDAQDAKGWLLTQQSSDGGFLAYDWGAGAFATNSSATADSVTALSGKGWVVSIYNPATSPSPSSIPSSSPSPSPTPSPSASTTSSSSSSTASPAPTPSPSPTPTPVVSPSPTPTSTPKATNSLTSTQTETPTEEPADQQVLGADTVLASPVPDTFDTSFNSSSNLLKSVYTFVGVLSIGGALIIWKMF